MGKPVEQALAELDFCAAIYEYYADNAPKLLADEPIELLDGEGSAFIRRSPYGVLLGIMPWNFPYYQVARFAGPNLAIGNTILLKHAPQCPESAEAMQEIYHEAGFPEDAYINIYASNEQIEWVIGDPRVRGVSLTGSSARARPWPRSPGATSRRSCSSWAAPTRSSCSAPTTSTRRSRTRSRPASTTPASPATRPSASSSSTTSTSRSWRSSPPPSPRSSRATRRSPRPRSARCRRPSATERLADQLKRALDNGAKLVAGGEHDGNFFKTTVLTDIGTDNPARHEEFFGPVAQVYRVSGEEEAVELANDTPYGLGSYLMTTDAEQAERVAAKIEAGMVFVNLVGADGAELPFGGVKNSGFGRELGRYGIDEFVNKKLIRIG